MDESCSNTYLESSWRRRTGGFSVMGTELVMSPLPLPRPRGVTIFLVLAFNLTTSSGTVLGFFGRRLVFSIYFLLEDELVEPVSLGG